MRKFVWVLLVACLLTNLVGLCQQRGEYYLAANITETTGRVTTDKGDRKAVFSGIIGFRAIPKGERFQLTLIELNLISNGIATRRGKSGVLGLKLSDEVATWYDPRTGQASFAPAFVLHYQLIDRIKGFKELGLKGETDLFMPFTETMKGELNVKFPRGLQMVEKGKTYTEIELDLKLVSRVLGSIQQVTLKFWVDLITFLRRPCQSIRVQPVFIGTGPNDPHRTGEAFQTLMNKASEVWKKCCSVRCIKFVVNTPIYLNKPQYRVLETKSEAYRLLTEVNVANAVEVFVVERMEFACDWGGGACFSSGTASAQIVTCDQQLDIPCPCPCTGYCPCGGCGTDPDTCGDVNYYHLAHELGHVLDLAHPPGPSGTLAASTVGSVMEPSGFCCDNPSKQSAKNCRNASNPLLYWSWTICIGKPDIMD
ncbi:hypothetical protein ACVNPS_02770 [Candidatus Bipolaricaulota sp. J31]